MSVVFCHPCSGAANVVRMLAWRARIAAEPPELAKAAPEDEPNRGRGEINDRPRVELRQGTSAIDVIECPRCQGTMRVIALVTERSSIRRFLTRVGQLVDVADRSPSRGPPHGKSVALPLLASGSCGNAASAVAKPPAFDPRGQTKCGVTRSHAEPLLVEWPSSDRAALSARTQACPSAPGRCRSPRGACRAASARLGSVAVACRRRVALAAPSKSAAGSRWARAARRPRPAAPARALAPQPTSLAPARRSP